MDDDGDVADNVGVRLADPKVAFAILVLLRTS
jgi:hypothetical protein